MKKNAQETEAGQQYTAAHEAHYTSKDLSKALKLYRVVIADHPETREAGYSWSQIQNIAGAVVPKQAIFDATVELVLAHKLPASSQGTEPNSESPFSSDSPGENT